jgi:signal transduction histidine kinase
MNRHAFFDTTTPLIKSLDSNVQVLTESGKQSHDPAALIARAAEKDTAPTDSSLFSRTVRYNHSMSRYRGNLQKRITIIILLGISVILLSLGVVSHYIIKKDIDDLLNKKLALSRLTRNNADSIIRENISRLYDISISGAVDLDDDDFGPEKEAVKAAYRYSIFTDGIFLLDNGGNILLNYPERMRETSLNILSIEPVSRMIALGKPVVSNIYTLEPSKKKVLYVLVPLRDKNGEKIGVAGGQIDPTSPLLLQKLGLLDIGDKEFIDIVDSNGVVIASSNPSRMFTHCDRNSFFTKIIQERKERVATCHVCHEAGDRNEKLSTVLAFVPLETAPWGISVQELKTDVFAPAANLKRLFIILGFIFIGTALVLTVGISRSIVNPLRDLIRSADRIARGDLSHPIAPEGSDEIGVLSRSFETMRARIVQSREKLQRYTRELEVRVKERTRQIRESQRRAERLLKKIISTSEDERKRIARELHDGTLQELSAALMRVDICRFHPEQVSAEKIDTIRDIIVKSHDGLLKTMQNLRPSLLDDLGLIAAVKSLLESHLGEKGILYFLNTADVKVTHFRPEVEITLFRIIQEAVVNIARHSQAESVLVHIKCDTAAVYTEIEDDGIGFDLGTLYLHPSDPRDRRGLGILGMKERALLLGGEMEICSQPDLGTRISVRIPLKNPEVDDAS